MKQELILSSINQYMVGFVHSLHMQSDLNTKKKVYPFSGDGVFLSPTVDEPGSDSIDVSSC